jgi:hypothetical protein
MFHSSYYRYLIWIGSDQEKTFGPTISGPIHRTLGPERVTLWDSKQRGSEESTFPLCFVALFLTGGRPDVMKLIKEVYRLWGEGNQEMMKAARKQEFRHLWFIFISSSIWPNLDCIL